VTLQIALVVALIFILSSCRRGQEILTVEIVQLPYKTVYISEAVDSLDMEGCVIRLHTRDGGETDIPFELWPFVTVSYEIDFSMPGEYEVFFYWQYIHIYTMTIQVIPAPE